VCYVSNTFGLREINAVAHEINGPQQAELRSRSQVTSEFIPTLSAQRREVFKSRLATAVGVHIKDLARQAALYLSPGSCAHLDLRVSKLATTPFLTSIVAVCPVSTSPTKSVKTSPP